MVWICRLDIYLLTESSSLVRYPAIASYACNRQWNLSSYGCSCVMHDHPDCHCITRMAQLEDILRASLDPSASLMRNQTTEPDPQPPFNPNSQRPTIPLFLRPLHDLRDSPSCIPWYVATTQPSIVRLGVLVIAQFPRLASVSKYMTWLVHRCSTRRFERRGFTPCNFPKST